ncbi:hypothetical protein [Paenibacillus koleovorans]|uniref:hypothetical protein n=1 Tax=Paenibacillus koleovorans TaxID=121608 RepID=UPI0013E2ADC7|nr:hypothetical protein [Paenibacillus koleovorans]
MAARLRVLAAPLHPFGARHVERRQHPGRAEQARGPHQAARLHRERAEHPGRSGDDRRFGRQGAERYARGACRAIAAAPCAQRRGDAERRAADPGERHEEQGVRRRIDSVDPEQLAVGAEPLRQRIGQPDQLPEQQQPDRQRHAHYV